MLWDALLAQTASQFESLISCKRGEAKARSPSIEEPVLWLPTSSSRLSFSAGRQLHRVSRRTRQQWVHRLQPPQSLAGRDCRRRTEISWGYHHTKLDREEGHLLARYIYMKYHLIGRIQSVIRWGYYHTKLDREGGWLTREVHEVARRW